MTQVTQRRREWLHWRIPRLLRRPRSLQLPFGESKTLPRLNAPFSLHNFCSELRWHRYKETTDTFRIRVSEELDSMFSRVLSCRQCCMRCRSYPTPTPKFG